MAKGGSTQTTQTQTSTPWSGAQPYLLQALQGAQNAYQSGNGFAPYPGSTVAPFSTQTQQALTGIENTADAGNPLAGASQGAALGILSSGGLTPQMASAAQGYGDIAGGAQPNAIGTDLAGYARGDYVNGGSPEFQKALDYQAQKTADDVNRGFSNAGRYGSVANAQGVLDAVGNLRNNAMAQELQREQGQQIQAAGLLSGEQQQGIGNRMAAYGGLGGIGQQGASNLAGFAGLAPGIYSQQFAPYQELAGAGSAYDTQAQNVLQSQIDKYNQTQQEPWNLLSAYNALIGGAGQLGSTTTTSVPKPSALQGILSGGLLGASAGAPFGLPGIAIGGGLGALSGLFG